MTARYLLWTTITIFVADVVAFSAIIFGLNYSRLLHTGSNVDFGSILSFWNCPWSITAFILFVVAAMIHLLCCVIFLQKTLLLLSWASSQMQKEKQAQQLYSGELTRISRKLAKDKARLQRSQEIVSQFMKHANLIPCAHRFNPIKPGKN